MNQSAFILIVSKKNRDGPCDVFWEKGKFLWLLNALWFILCVLSIKTIRSDSFFECVISHRMTLLYFYWDNDIKHQFEIQIKKSVLLRLKIVELCAGFRSRSREPAIKIDGSETLRHPVDLLLLELMKAYIFWSL